MINYECDLMILVVKGLMVIFDVVKEFGIVWRVVYMNFFVGIYDVVKGF